MLWLVLKKNVFEDKKKYYFDECRPSILLAFALLFIPFLCYGLNLVAINQSDFKERYCGRY